jgi:hypothetical protein
MKNKRLAIYTKLDENMDINTDKNYQAKKETIITMAEYHGYRLEAEYIDGVTNESSYSRMINDAKNNMFEMLVVIEFDNISELDINHLEYDLDLIGNGIEIEYFYDLIEYDRRARSIHKRLSNFWNHGIELSIDISQGGHRE